MKKLILSVIVMATLAFIAPVVSHAQSTNHFYQYPPVTVSSSPPNATAPSFTVHHLGATTGDTPSGQHQGQIEVLKMLGIIVLHPNPWVWVVLYITG